MSYAEARGPYWVVSSWLGGPRAVRPDITPKGRVTTLNAFSSAQTRNFLGPELVLKGLQGETEEVLSSISLSMSILKGLYHAYDFCCANMRLFFKVQLDVRAGSGRGEALRELHLFTWGCLGQARPPLFLPPKRIRNRCRGSSLLPWHFPE